MGSGTPVITQALSVLTLTALSIVPSEGLFSDVSMAILQFRIRVSRSMAFPLQYFKIQRNSDESNQILQSFVSHEIWQKDVLKRPVVVILNWDVHHR